MLQLDGNKEKSIEVNGELLATEGPKKASGST